MRRALLRRRGADDREEVVRERLRVYREKTEPLVGYYRRARSAARDRRQPPIDEVHRRGSLDALEAGRDG